MEPIDAVDPRTRPVPVASRRPTKEAPESRAPVVDATPIGPTRWTQFVYDQVYRRYHVTPETRLARAGGALFERLFRRIRRAGDPLVRREVGGQALWLPLSHQLPFILKAYPGYGANLVRIACSACSAFEGFRLIDVGANVGDTAALLRAEAAFPVLCIEGDETFYAVLERNAALFSEVHLCRAYLGETSEEISVASCAEGGTAYLNGAAEGHPRIRIRTLPDVLRDHPAFATAKMLKIDTDGFDAKVIRGAVDFLLRAKPVLFFEYDPVSLTRQGDDGLSVFRMLGEAGYHRVLVYDNVGDLMLATTVGDAETLRMLHLYFAAPARRHYGDLCVFHGDDEAFFERVRSQEIRFFERQNGGA